MQARYGVATLALLAGLTMVPRLRAQQPPPPPPPAQDGRPAPPPRGRPGEAGRGARGDSSSAALRMPPGRWWDEANNAQAIGLSAVQIEKMDAIFDGARDHLIDLDAAVRKAEGGLPPLLDHDPIDRVAAWAQIQRLTQARAELEDANAAMLLDLRLQLTHEQWGKLSSLRPPPPPPER